MEIALYPKFSPLYVRYRSQSGITLRELISMPVLRKLPEAARIILT